MKSVYIALILTLFAMTTSIASHIRGGEILASHMSGQTYQIKVRLYLDPAYPATAAQQLVTVCFGDGSTAEFERSATNPVPGNANISVSEYTGRHTFSGAGIYQISCALQERVGNLVNLPLSQNTSVFLWTVLNTTVANSTPEMPYLNLEAGARQLFTVDLTPPASEADSVTVRIARLSKPSPGVCAVRMEEKSYLFPNEVSASGTFKIDAVQKRLVWQAPVNIGTYIFAIVVNEWRDGIKISESYREGTVEVIDKPGDTVEIPPYEAVETAELITAVPNPDSQELSMAVEAYPVPTERYVKVDVHSKTRAVIKMQLIDLKGRVLKKIDSKQIVTTTSEIFDLGSYPAGIYLIKAENGIDSVTKKVAH